MKKPILLSLMILLCKVVTLIAQDLYVGSNQSGQTINITNNTTNDSVYIGYANGSGTQPNNNTLNVYTNITLTINQNLYVCYDGSNNALTASNNTHIQVINNSYLGYNIDASGGIISLTENSLFNINNQNTNFIGYAGANNIFSLDNSTNSCGPTIISSSISSSNNQLLILNSSQYSNGACYLGGSSNEEFGSGNIITVSNSSLINNGDHFFIGSSNNQLNVLDNSTNNISGRDFHIYNGPNNTVTISNNSQVYDNLLFVGGTNNTNLGTFFNSSNNIINIFDYSTWSNVYGGTGTNTITSSGNQIIVSNNSILYCNDDTCLGYYGSDNTIEIIDSSMLNCNAVFYIGTNQIVTTNNSVTINNSTWSNGNTICVGNSNGSSGNITVTNGGQINAANILVYNGNLSVSDNNNALGTNMNLLLNPNNILSSSGGENISLVLSASGTTSLNLQSFNFGYVAIKNINPSSQIINVSNQVQSISTNDTNNIYFIDGISFNNSSSQIIYSQTGQINTNSFNTNINYAFQTPNITGSGIGFSISSYSLDFSIATNANLTNNNQSISQVNTLSLNSLVLNSGSLSVLPSGGLFIASSLSESNANVSVSSNFMVGSSNTNFSNSLIVGIGASTTLNSINSTNTVSNNLVLGNGINNNTINSTNSIFTILNSLTLGNGANNNTFNASNSTINISNSLTLGNEANNNILNASSSTINISNSLILGIGNGIQKTSLGASNAMSIYNSTLTVASNLILGAYNSNNSIQPFSNSLLIDASQLNILNNSITNTNANSNYSLMIGENGFNNSLIITNGGTVSSSLAAIGYNTTASNNSAIVTGSGSIWNNTNGFYDGFQGGNNTLLISNGGAMYINNGTNSPYSYVGLSSSSNQLIITGSDSIFSNQGALVIGFYGNNNQVNVTSGGTLICNSNVANGLSYSCILGAEANSNFLTIGTNSLFSNNGNLYIGYSGSYNAITNNGGTLISTNIYVGISTNTVNEPVGISNTLVVAGGVIDAANITISSAGTFIISNGTINITNWLTNSGYISNNGQITTGEYINSGTYIQGTSGSLTITNPSTFYNLGTIILDPGQKTFDGHFVESPKGTIIDNILSPRNGYYGQLHFTQSPVILAGRLHLNFINNYAPLDHQKILKILTSEKGIIGNFDSITSSDPSIQCNSFLTNNNRELDVSLVSTNSTKLLH